MRLLLFVLVLPVLVAGRAWAAPRVVLRSDPAAAAGHYVAWLLDGAGVAAVELTVPSSRGPGGPPLASLPSDSLACRLTARDMPSSGRCTAAIVPRGAVTGALPLGQVLLPEGAVLASTVRARAAGEHGELLDLPVEMADAVAAAPPQVLVQREARPGRGIRYLITPATAGHTSLRVLDVRGRLVRTVATEEWTVEPHAGRWDGTDANGAHVSSGIYWLCVATPSGRTDRRFVFLP